jgi:DNA (cytosine-5)-methyltransferase 1
MAIRSISLCAGVGALDLGLRLADPDIRTVCYVEWAKFPAAVIAARIADKTLDDAPVWDDVTTFDGRPWRGCVDIITAGFPCQPVSLAGQRRGMADERFIWGDIARIIGEVRPGRVLLENVPGIVSADGGRFLDVVLGSLVALGFDCQWDLFSAEETGAPHRRQRWFCLAVSNAGRGTVVGRSGICADASTSCGALAHTTDNLRRPSGDAGRVAPDRTGDSELAYARHYEPSGRIPPESGQQSGRGGSSQRQPSPLGSPLADTGDGFVQEPGRGSQERNGARPTGAVLANSDDHGFRNDRECVRVAPSQSATPVDSDSLVNAPSGTRQRPAQRDTGHAALAVETVADAERIASEQQSGTNEIGRRSNDSEQTRMGSIGIPELVIANGRQQQPGYETDTIGQGGNARHEYSGTSRGVYPPTRNDYAGWSAIDASAQPAIRRVADGLADGLDQSLFAYRNDRLRAVGNGVVPLTVATAWLELNDRIR